MTTSSTDRLHRYQPSGPTGEALASLLVRAAADHQEHGARLFVAVLRDRAEQQHQAIALQEALAALGESERRTTTILESLPVGVVVTDAEGIMTYTNPAAVALGMELPRDDDGDPLPFYEAYSAATELP